MAYSRRLSLCPDGPLGVMRGSVIATISLVIGLAGFLSQ